MEFIADGGYTHLLIGSSFTLSFSIVMSLYLALYHNTIDSIRGWFACPFPE